MVRSKHLWRYFYRRDFQGFDEDFDEDCRVAYLSRLSAMRREDAVNLEQIQSLRREIETYRRMQWQQLLIDALQLRCMLPLPFVSLFVSVLLLALRLDGNTNLSFFVCLAPLMLLFVYLLLSLAVTVVIHRQRAVVAELWQFMSGPMRVLFSSRIADSSLFTGLLFAVFLLLAAQVALIAVKLVIFGTSISWGVIFTPFWVLFAMFCLTPLIRCVDIAFFCSALVVLIPVLILFACLAAKFDREEAHQNLPKIYMSAIFSPFWMLELLVLLATIGTAIKTLLM